MFIIVIYLCCWVFSVFIAKSFRSCRLRYCKLLITDIDNFRVTCLLYLTVSRCRSLKERPKRQNKLNYKPQRAASFILVQLISDV